MANEIPVADIRSILVILFSIGLTDYAHASTDTDAKSDKENGNTNTLIVLKVADDDVGDASEQRFVMELSLILEGIKIIEMAPTESDFSELKLGEQISYVRPIIETHDAIAATWLEPVSPDLLILHMVAVSSGRALARIVEIEPTQGFESDLAMAARELLRTSFLLVEESDGEDNPSSEAVLDKTTTPPKSEPDWHVLVLGKLEGGILGHEGPGLLAGGSLAADRRIVKGFFGRVFLGVKGGFLNADEKLALSTFGLEPGLGILHLWNFERLSLASVLELQLSWSKVTAEREDLSSRSFSYFSYRFAGLLEFGIKLLKHWDVLLGIGLNATPHQEVFERASTGSTVLATPYLGWETRLGFRFVF